MKTLATVLALACALPALAADGARLSPVALGRIDAHAHFFAEARPVLDLLDRLNLTAVNVCVVDRYDKGYETVEPQQRDGAPPREGRAAAACPGSRPSTTPASPRPASPRALSPGSTGRSRRGHTASRSTRASAWS